MAAMSGKGGPWTERKLKAVGSYVKAFNTALKKQPFKRIYIDAFAGSGDRELRKLPLLENDTDVAGLAKGSVRIALESKPAFDRLIFIEKSKRHVKDLQTVVSEHPESPAEIYRADANIKLIEICRNWDTRNWRGVLFVDPYGCQLEWAALEAVAFTRSIDVWVLFPVNAVRRMLPVNRKFGKGWRERLTALFGTNKWEEHFYEKQDSPQDLFGYSEAKFERNVSLERIEAYYQTRLGTIFRGGVADRPLRLGPRSQEALFSLFFACSNPSPRARGVAFNIANHLIRKWDG